MIIFYLKKLITSLILPPGIVILILAFGGLYLIRRKIKTGYLFLLCAFSLYLLSTVPVQDALLIPLEDSFSIHEPVRGDVIVMLGGGVFQRAPDLGGEGFPSDDSLARVVSSYRLWKRLRVPIIISGGKISRQMQAESGVGKRVLTDMGVPAKEIIEEDRSKDTSENSYYVAGIIREKGFRSPILVTSAYHMKRAVANFRKMNLEVISFPCGFRAAREPYTVLDLLPSAASLSGSVTALREYIGLAVTQYVS